MKKYKIMKKIFSPTLSRFVPKGFSGLLKPALLVLVLVVLGSKLSFGQVSVQVLNSTNVPTLVQNNSIGYTVPPGVSRMLLVMISNSDGRTVSAITFNGTDLTLVTSKTSDPDARTHIYRLMNPAVGTGTLVVNFNGATGQGANIGIVSLGSVDQTDPTPTSANTYANSATISHSVTSVAGQRVFNVVISREVVLDTAGTGQTEMWNVGNGSRPNYHGGSYITATGTSTTMTWNKSGSNKWSMSLVSVKPACISASVSVTNPTCSGGPNGSITVSSPAGGSGTYQYRLDAGTWQSSGNFTGLAPGIYSVQIRDANNTACEVTLGSYTLATNPVLFDATSSNVFNSGTTVSLNHTTGSGNNRLMLVGVSTRERYITVGTAGDGVTTVTYDGNNLIYLGHEQSNSEAVTYLFMLPDPPSGTNLPLSVTFTAALGANNAAVIGIVTYSNVDLNNPVGSYFSSPGNDASPTLTINSTKTNQIVFNVLAATAANTTVTPNSGQTQRWLQSTANRPTGGGYGRLGSATSTTFNYTLSSSQRWSLSGVAINPALVSDLAVTKAVNFAGPYAGQTIQFTLTATNLGCDNALNTVVMDELPSGFTYVSHSTANGTYNGGSGEWAIGTLNVGSTATLTINAVVNNSGVYNNVATISADVSDPNTGNNTASVSIVLCQAGGTQPLFNN